MNLAGKRAHFFASVAMTSSVAFAESPQIREDSPAASPTSSSISPAKSSEKNFDGFAAARSEILTLIGGATQNIRIVTDFLSDGEIVSALYIAQYRKVNVQVLLGPGRATSALSRLNFLKAQNIPVWLRPRSFMSSHPTVLLVDQNLYALNAELDYMARHRKFTLATLPAHQIPDFEQNFQTAASTGFSPTPKPTPLVGRSGSGGGRKGARQNQAVQETDPYDTSTNTEHDGFQMNKNRDSHYRYSRQKDRPSTGVPTKLPKNTILQDREQQH